MADQPDEYEEQNRRDKRIQGMLSDYDDELQTIEDEISQTEELLQAVQQKLTELKSRRSDLQIKRADRHGDLQMSEDDFPTVSRIVDLGR